MAHLPSGHSTALMLGVPAQVAGCKNITLATPPRQDGSISPEIIYIAQLTGVKTIVKAGGAHAIAAMAYGTESVPKADKLYGPGNQFVTAAKMVRSLPFDLLNSRIDLFPRSLLLWIPERRLRLTFLLVLLRFSCVSSFLLSLPSVLPPFSLF
jgi:hypothetical protein